MSTGQGVPDRKGGRGQLQKGMERRLLVKGVTYLSGVRKTFLAAVLRLECGE